MSAMPLRYLDYFKDIWVDVPEPVVMTAFGPRTPVARRWVCRLCGKALKPNTAGAQSHVAKHVRENGKG